MISLMVDGYWLWREIHGNQSSQGLWQLTGRKAFSKKLTRDFTLVLKGGAVVPVCSEVLCWDNSVFTTIVQELELTCHELEDFEYDAVECFIQCLYTGDSKSLPTADLYKMADVFAVKWLKFDCSRFFQGLLDKISRDDLKLNKICFFILGGRFCLKKLAKIIFSLTS